MSTNTTDSAATASHAAGQQADRGPAFVAYSILRYGFIALPLLMGLDKFFNVLTDWPGYLAPWIADLSPMSPQATMYVVGVIEIVAAVAMVIKPRYASYVVALWLALIIIDLLTLSGYYDVALRDFGLLLAALALARLASVYDTAWPAKR
jgi:hypothetical protein